MESESDGMAPVNLGNPNEPTINDLLDRVLARTGTSADRVVYRLLRRTIRAAVAPTSAARRRFSDGFGSELAVAPVPVARSPR